ncbi:MAG: hypothetical protein JWL73_883 [Actinomycetia bacterium]|nr:hypothetical protein [Actinomycetes bacterium]
MPSSPAQWSDTRMYRFDQGALAILLIAGFVFGIVWVIPLCAVIFAIGPIFGPANGPFLRLFHTVVRPRLGPTVLEDSRPPRFAALLSVVILAVASVFALLGADALAWVLALAVAVAAAVSATTGICAGCELYAILERRRGSG